MTFEREHPDQRLDSAYFATMMVYRLTDLVYTVAITAVHFVIRSLLGTLRGILQ
jgi:hypothetical protein